MNHLPFSILLVITSVLQIILLNFWFRLTWPQTFKIMAFVWLLFTPVIYMGLRFMGILVMVSASPARMGIFNYLLFINLAQLIIISLFESLILRWIGKIEIRKSFLWLFVVASFFYVSSLFISFQLQQAYRGSANVDEGKVDHLKSLTIAHLETLMTLPENASPINIDRVEADGSGGSFLDPYGPEVRTLGQGVDFIYDRTKSSGSSKYVSFTLKRSTGEGVDLTAKVVESAGSANIYEIWPIEESKAVLFAGQFLLAIDLQKLKLCGTKIQLSPNAITLLHRKDQDLFLTQEFPSGSSSVDFVFNGVKKLDLTKICSD